MPGASEQSDGAAVITAAAREGEADRYLAALLSPRPVRDDLIALAAVAAELNRISIAVADPHLAEIRLQWWRDTLLAGEGAASGNPIADAFRDVMRRHALPQEALQAWLDALAHTFYAAPPEDEAHLMLEHELIDGTVFLFAAVICGAKSTQALADSVRHAGVAYGLARLGTGFARSLARGRMPLPDFSGTPAEGAVFDAGDARGMLTRLARAQLSGLKAAFHDLEAPARSALLPLALVEPYLQALEMQDHDLTRDLAEVAPLIRVWRIWRAHRSKRL
ncbi:MAG: squalene/phytoene synthase family protein [Hyphomicrobium sp.]